MMFERRMTGSEGLAASWTGLGLGFAMPQYHEMTLYLTCCHCISLSSMSDFFRVFLPHTRNSHYIPTAGLVASVLVVLNIIVYPFALRLGT